MVNVLRDVKHWRERAEETRAKADRIWRDGELRRKLLRVAEEYDRLAERAEQWRDVHSIEGNFSRIASAESD